MILCITGRKISCDLKFRQRPQEAVIPDPGFQIIALIREKVFLKLIALGILVIDLRIGNRRFARGGFIGEHDLGKSVQIGCQHRGKRDDRGKRRMSVQESALVAFDHLRMQLALRLKNACLRNARQQCGLFRGITVIDLVSVSVPELCFQQIQCDNGIFAAADRNQPSGARRPLGSPEILLFIAAFDRHEAVEIGLNAVAVEKLAQSAEIQPLPPVCLLLCHLHTDANDR